MCGGLGPTQDDVTREAVAQVMGVRLERREDLVEHIAAMFGTRGRDMPENNLRQADVPAGGGVIPNPMGTAPGLECEITGEDGRTRVIYAVPGVPYEMQGMVHDHVLPDLLQRSGERAVIVSRSLKTWGTSESGLAEMIAHRVDVQGNPTIAFLARGIEGLYVRLTAKAPNEAEARELIAAEEAQLRSILGELIFAVDDETMESNVLAACEAKGWTLGVAESLTGGLVGARITNIAGASRAFRGGIASYATDVKRDVLGVTAEHVVSADCAIEMAEGVQRLLGCDVAISTTGVAGPEEQDDQPVGTVWFGIAVPGTRPRPCRPACPATASGSGSSRRSPCSTCSACASPPWAERCARSVRQHRHRDALRRGRAGRPGRSRRPRSARGRRRARRRARRRRNVRTGSPCCSASSSRFPTPTPTSVRPRSSSIGCASWSSVPRDAEDRRGVRGGAVRRSGHGSCW